MKPEHMPITMGEFKKYATSSKMELPDGTVMHTMKINFTASLNVDPNSSAREQEIMEHLLETLLRRIYDYDHQELYEAWQSLMTCDPFSWDSQQQALSKILRASKRQPPK
jgi:hypothetical protein